MATNRLRVRALHTVGFVDKGDDPKAEVVFFKRADKVSDVKKGVVMEDGKFSAYDTEGNKLGVFATREEAEAAVKLAADKLKGGTEPPTKEPPMFDVKKLDATAQAEFKKLSDRVAELEIRKGIVEEGGKFCVYDADGKKVGTYDTREEAKASMNKAAPVPEAVQKQLDDLRKQATDAQAQVQKLTDERENQTFITKAKELSLTPDDFGPMLRKISKALDATEMKKLETLLKALAAQVKEGGLYREIGSGGSSTTTETETQVEAAVAEVQKANPKFTRERAHGEVMKARPDLRNQLERERTARTSQPADGED